VIKKKKLKIVWLCHFANSEINNYFNTKVNELAPWINNLIEIFNSNDDFELHIVSPNYFNNKSVVIKLRNIEYHFYRRSFIWPNRLNYWVRIDERSNYNLVKRIVGRIIRKIQPDIIHLHGAENPIYSSAILPLINKYKILLTIQGFISLDPNQEDRTIKYRSRVETKIIHKISNFGVRTNDTCNVIRSYNDNPKFYWHNYPMTKPLSIKLPNDINTEYDCVFFARLSPENGIEDLLRAIHIVKKQKSDISLVVIGHVQMDLDFLKQLCIELNIQDNVEFKGFFASQHDAHKEVIKAKIKVLPTYYDVIPGTILECMYMGLPVIAYAVGAIPELNSERKSIILVERGSITGLSNKIIQLLNDDELRNKITEKGRITAKTNFDNQAIYNDISSIYQKIAY
jgi:glycosyltransferase involved in cell wall biosynthesis